MASSTADATSAMNVDASAVESVLPGSPMTPATGGNDSLAAAPSFESEVRSELRAITFFCISGRSRGSRATFERHKKSGRSRAVDHKVHDIVHTFLIGSIRVAARGIEGQRLFVPIRFSRNACTFYSHHVLTTQLSRRIRHVGVCFGCRNGGVSRGGLLCSTRHVRVQKRSASSCSPCRELRHQLSRRRGESAQPHARNRHGLARLPWARSTLDYPRLLVIDSSIRSQRLQRHPYRRFAVQKKRSRVADRLARHGAYLRSSRDAPQHNLLPRASGRQL